MKTYSFTQKLPLILWDDTYNYDQILRKKFIYGYWSFDINLTNGNAKLSVPLRVPFLTDKQKIEDPYTTILKKILRTSWIVKSFFLEFFYLYFQLRFEAIVGAGSEGDIALDDITFKEGPCPSRPTCTFEQGLCGYKQIDNQLDNFDWTVGKIHGINAPR